MARQGSLRQETARYRCKSPARVGLCALLLTMLGLVTANPAPAAGLGEVPTTDVRVVFEFQSPSPRTWNFQLRLADAPDSQASLSNVRNLSSAETTSGIFLMDHSGQMLGVHSRHAIAGGKFELRIRASRQAKLWVEPSGNPTTEGQLPPPREIAIIDLLNGDRMEGDRMESEPPSTGAAGAAGWSIQRVTKDGLRVDDLQPVPVYRPGVPLEFSVHVNGMTDHASQPRVLHYELYRVGDGEIVETRHWPVELDAFGNSQIVSVSEIVPDIPGVYELRLQLEFDEETIWSRLRRRPPPLVRVTHSIAVLHGEVGAETGEPSPWREVGRIRPSESTWSVGQWLPKPNSRLIPGASIPQPPDLESDSHAGQSVSLLPPLGTFQATLPVQTAGYPHKVTIRIPSTSTADLQVEIGRSQQEVTTSFVLESDATADHQGLWREHTFVHYPVDDDQIWLTNLDTTNPTPFDSIAVQAGPLYLAPHATPDGTTESASAVLTRTVVMRMSNLDWTAGLIADVPQRADYSECAPSTIALNDLWFAAERVQDEARASGCNGIVIPANSGATTWYTSSLFQAQDDPLVSRHHRLETLLQLLESSQLRIYVGLTPNMLVTELERSIQQQESLLVELTRSESTSQTSRSGAASTETVPSRTQYNPLHPLVQNAIGGLVKELSDLCNRYDGFTGVIIDCGGTSHLRPAQNASADAGSILLFGRGNHPSSSVAQLRSWIQQQGNEAFQNWERAQLQQCYAQISKATDARMVRLLIPRIAAVDGAEAAKTVGTISSLRYGPPGVLAKKSSMQHKLMTLAGPLPAVLLGEEASTGAPALVREQLSDDLCRMINRADPELLLVDRSLLAHRQDPKLSGTLRSFCALPNRPLAESSPIDSASHTVRLRSGAFDGHLYVAMTSEVPWNTDVDLETTAPTQWKVVGRTDTAHLTQFSGGTRTRVAIPTGQMVVLRSSEPSTSAVRSWTTRVAGGPEAIESIKQKVTLIVERIGILNDFTPYASLTNGGFEQSGDMGLVGWLHAQHPPGCVELDDKEFAEGSHSVMLTTITPAVARTWLVSETIDPPQSGRLAVSLACKAEANTDESPHLLRVSIEATRQGEPIRFTRDLEVARNGQWNHRDVILEADEIDTTSIESLRLTIDSLSGGRVWIDDVQLHDRFPTEKERTELQSQAFLAVQGLQRGKLLPTGKLLQNHWARHLLTLGAIETSKPATEVLPAPAEPPSVTERIRNWLPRPLRF